MLVLLFLLFPKVTEVFRPFYVLPTIPFSLLVEMLHSYLAFSNYSFAASSAI